MTRMRRRSPEPQPRSHAPRALLLPGTYIVPCTLALAPTCSSPPRSLCIFHGCLCPGSC